MKEILRNGAVNGEIQGGGAVIDYQSGIISTQSVKKLAEKF